MATQGQQHQQSVTRVQSSILRTNESNNYLYEEQHQLHQKTANKNINSTSARRSFARNNSDKQQKHLLRNHQSTPQKPVVEVSDLDLDSQATYATAYATYQNGHNQNGRPASRQQTRPSRPPRRLNGTTTANGNDNELSFESRAGDDPQRVRLNEHYTSGRSHSAAPGPRASHAPTVVTTRTGRFVDSYPASRQPARSSGRSTSPYAFHVPPPPPPLPPLAINTRSDRSTIYATPTSRATSPSYAYAEYYYNNSNSNDPAQLVSPRASGRGHYGYVARTEGDQIRQPAASKFNRSLRSRTIAHLPSMVQVINGEGLEDPHDETELLHHNQCGNVGATSEGDLLKAHTIAWRSSDLGRENPFKPGTELSFEADLMVRLIKRGYPMDELPQLVEAAKSEVAAKASLRSKSCDRLTQASTNQQAVVSPSQGQGYLRANLRREAERQQPQMMSHSRSHHELGSHKPEVASHENKPTAAESQCDLENCSRAKPPAHQLDEAKAVWANSLKRAKSMPRFNSTTCRTDADSLDQLITSIELEISDLLERTTTTTNTTTITGGSYENNKPQQVATENNKLISENGEEEAIRRGHKIELNPTRKRSKTGSPLKAEVSSRPKTASSSPSSSPKREQASSRRTSGQATPVSRRGQVSTAGQDLKTGAPRPLKGQAEPRAIEKKDKPRCCSIQ